MLGYYLAKRGYECYLKRIENQGDFFITNLILGAAGGHFDIVNFYCSHIQGRDLNRFIFCEVCPAAAKGGHFKMLKMLLSKVGHIYYPEIRGILYGSAESGNLEMVQYVVNLGATDYNDALIYAVSGAASHNTSENHLAVIKFLVKKGATNLYKIIDSVRLYSHHYPHQYRYSELLKELITLINIPEDTNILNEVMITAINRGNLDLVELLYEKGVTNLNRSLLCATQSGHLEIVQLIVQRGVNYTSIYHSVLWSCILRRWNVFRYLLGIICSRFKSFFWTE